MEVKNILSIDGGGIRGIIALKILQSLETKIYETYQLRLHNVFEFYAGTSTGSIVATLLAKGYHVKDIIDFYVDYGDYIFKKEFLRYGIIRPKYDDKNINYLLNSFIGDRNITTLNRKLLIPAFNKTTKSINFFTNTLEHDKTITDVLLYDAVRASIAAPTFLTSHDINKETFVDGGLSVNNPSEAMYWAAKRLHPNATINIFSVGTGTNSKKLKKFNQGGGMIQWAQPTVDILLAQQALSTHRTLTEMYSYNIGTYFRAAPEIILCNGKMDDASVKNVKNMLLDGENCAKLYDTQINNFVSIL